MVHKMSFYTQIPSEASRPADEGEMAKHTKQNICTIPPNASQHVSKLESSTATGITTVGDGFVSAGKAVTKGIEEFTSAIGDAAGKVQSGIAQAQSAAQDPASFIVGLAEQATGFSVPSSPEGLLNLLQKFSKPKANGDGRTDIARTKQEGETIIDEIGDVASLSADQLSSKISSVSSAISSVTSTVGEAAGAVTQLASLGGVPVDNVISQSVSNVTSPVQSTLTKVQNVSDGTQGIIT